MFHGALFVHVKLHGDDVARIKVSPERGGCSSARRVLDFIAFELKRLGFRIIALDLEGYHANK
jgi:PP-loop superfamily ATP-utilizing enzyme